MNKQYSLIVFDVDGTLTCTASGETFRKNAADWQWLPGRLEKLTDLDQQGVKLGIATNQGGVAFGLLDATEIQTEIANMADEAHISYINMCFSHPNAKISEHREHSPRRKPGPGMLLEIMAWSRVSKEDVLFVGDRDEDEQAAKAAGVAFEWAGTFFAS